MRKLPEIPRPRDASAEVEEIENRISAFALRVRELQKERAALAASVSDAQSSAVVTPRSARVAALLGETAITPSPPTRARLSEIVSEIADLHEAIDAADRKKRVALSKASAQICAQVRPEYTARVRAIADALKGVHRATLDLHELTEALQSNGVEWSILGAASPFFMGSPSDPSSPLAYWYRDAIEQGHLKPADMPSELRPK